MPDFLRGYWKKLRSYAVPTEHNAYRPHLLHSSWLLFFLALILTAEGVLLTNVFAGQSARDFLAAVLPSQVVELTNLERGFTNAAPLKENALLTKAAQAKARDMAAKGYFAHVSPEGKQPWNWLSEAGYRYGAAGENLAVRFSESKDVVEAWMASPSHRANIIKPTYREIGVGVAQGMYKGSQATFVVQYFGRPAATAAAELEATPLAVAPQDATVLGVAAEAMAKQDAASMVASVGAAPTAQASGILIAAAGFMVLLVLLTVVVSPQVQPVDLILGGGGVAAVAIALLILNFSYIGPLLHNSQTASVQDGSGEVLIGEPAEIDTETNTDESPQEHGDSALAS